MLPNLAKAVFLAFLPCGLLVTTGARAPRAAPVPALSGALPALELDLGAWIDVRRTDPIHSEPRLVSDTLLGRVAAWVAEFTRDCGGLAGTDSAALAEHLEKSFPSGKVVMSVAAEEYFWFIDAHGNLVRVCVGVEELTLAFAGSNDAVVVRVRRQLPL